MWNGKLWGTNSDILTLEKLHRSAVQVSLRRPPHLSVWLHPEQQHWVKLGGIRLSSYLWMLSDVAVPAVVGWQHTFCSSHVFKPWDSQLLCFDSKSRELVQMQTSVLQTSKARWYKFQCRCCKDGRQMLPDQCSAGDFCCHSSKFF